MKVSIPGFPGVYYDTDAEQTAISTTLTLAGRRAPKPHGYAAQVLPFLWSIDVDLREVPQDHPLQYLHPEGAHSLEELPRDKRIKVVARDADFALRFAGEVNQRTETALSQLVTEVNEGVEDAIARVVGHKETDDEVVIEIDAEDGSLEMPVERSGGVRDDERGLVLESGADEPGDDERTIEIESERENETEDESEREGEDESETDVESDDPTTRDGLVDEREDVARDDEGEDEDEAEGGGPEFGEGFDDAALDDEPDGTDDSRGSES